MQAYEALAAVYDALNGDVNYKELADFYQTAFQKENITPQLVLDLGCGTGKMTVELAKRGYDMIGIDSSADMLSRAFERKSDMGADGILFLQQDMRSFELYGTVGAVVSSLDCVNYLVGEGELERCFSLVHNYLDKDGVFLFDVNTPHKFSTVFADNAYILESESCYCGWQNEYDEKSGLCRFYLSIFEELEDGTWRRTDEEQCERCYTKQMLTKALLDAGFADIEFYGGTDMRAATDTDERWFIKAICKK